MYGSPMLGEAEIGWDVPELDDLELAVQFVHGADLPSGAIVPGAAFTPGAPSGLRRVAYQVSASERATVALVTVNEQAPVEVVHPDAAVRGREEIALDFGDASLTSARFWARRYLDEVSNARRGLTIELMPGVGPQPYRDFDIGDSVLVLGERHRVVAIGWKVDADSIIRWSVDLDQPRMWLEERLAAIMRRQLPGAAGGRTVLPSPVEPPFIANQAGKESTETWTWIGTVGAPSTIAFYKNGVAVTGATLTVTAGAAASRVTLTNAARKYVRRVDKFTLKVDGGTSAWEWTPTEGRWVQEISATADASGDGITIILAYA